MLVDGEGGQPEVEGEVVFLAVLIHDRRHGLVADLDHEAGEVAIIGGLDDGDRTGITRQVPGPGDFHVADAGESELAVVSDREPAGVQPDRLTPVPLGLKSRGTHPPTDAFALQRVDKVLVGGVAVADGLLEHNVRALAQPSALVGVLSVGDQSLLQHGPDRKLLAGLVGVSTGAYRVVVDNTGVAERLRQYPSLSFVRVEPVAVPQLHD
nr:hypothetical protein [Actinopolyspora alba]